MSSAAREGGDWGCAVVVEVQLRCGFRWGSYRPSALAVRACPCPLSREGAPIVAASLPKSPCLTEYRKQSPRLVLPSFLISLMFTQSNCRSLLHLAPQLNDN